MHNFSIKIIIILTNLNSQVKKTVRLETVLQTREEEEAEEAEEEEEEEEEEEVKGGIKV